MPRTRPHPQVGCAPCSLADSPEAGAQIVWLRWGGEISSLSFDPFLTQRNATYFYTHCPMKGLSHDRPNSKQSVMCSNYSGGVG
jgi:hypothetical protein